ncbi:MAG TPA: sigma-70 family RNA polymerase sigma factor [Acidimicrobiales bacterium]|nr:sigma-70 family RNA polymerase sigma factor [Acidimicrobiales bacterium]
MDLPPFQLLLDEHAAALHRFCVAQAGPLHGPDCFQEAILAALRAYPGLTSAENLRGWLFTIAHRKVLDHHRGTARRPTPVADPAEVSVPPASPDGEVWAAVARLPEKQRGAIALRYLADLPYREIAELLDCSEGAARQNVRAGLAGLRQEVSR